MAAPKKIKGGLIRITDTTVATTTDLELEISANKVRNLNQDDVYVEMDLTTAKQVNLTLPPISSFNGLLNLNVWVSDIKGTVDLTNNLTIKVAVGSGDTIGGQEEVSLVGKFSGMYLTPLSTTQWGTFYTQNFSRKQASIPVDAELPVFKPLP